MRPLFMQQSLPGVLWTMVGNLPVDGDLQRFTLPDGVGVGPAGWRTSRGEDGYLNFDPDPAPSGVQGWADQGGGVELPISP